MIDRLKKSELVRYALVAAGLVGVEVGVFVLMNTVLGISYLIATPVSTIVVIILNWYLSGKWVFHNHVHSPRKEFVLVVIVSVIGIGIQTAVASLVVEVLRLAPLVAKLAAIGVTFFWNFWVRRRYIFPTLP